MLYSYPQDIELAYRFIAEHNLQWPPISLEMKFENNYWAKNSSLGAAEKSFIDHEKSIKGQ
jgi:hypothetical protein